jgi:SagB-type dehydrogenase family enzyme
MRHVLGAFLVAAFLAAPATAVRAQVAPIKLPDPVKRGTVSVEEALQARRSVRAYADSPLTLAQLGQILWAAQGITAANGHRTAPSAGALYPLELYVVVGNVTGIPAGVYKYRPQGHELVPHLDGDVRATLARAAVRQGWVAQIPAMLAITAVPERTRVRYGERTDRFVAIEVGHVGQNVYLEAVSLGLGTVMAGAITDDSVAAVLKLDPAERPLAVMPIGRPR